MMDRTVTTQSKEQGAEVNDGANDGANDSGNMMRVMSMRRSGKEEHAERVRTLREQRLLEVNEGYLQRLRSAREQYRENKKVAQRNKRSMFEPSIEMLEYFGGLERPPTNCKSKKTFWDDEDGKTGGGGASEGEGGGKEEEPTMTSEEIEAEVDRLKGRAMEVEAVLRLDFGAAGCIEQATEKLHHCSQFYEELQTVADKLGVLKGAAFQEMLSRGTGNPRGHINRDRVTGLVKLEDVLDGETLSAAIEKAEGLCDLVRVKIEDDNDLGLALSVVQDSTAFIDEMKRVAKLKKTGEAEFMEELREF
jgi:hypothetical protein